MGQGDVQQYGQFDQMSNDEKAYHARLLEQGDGVDFFANPPQGDLMMPQQGWGMCGPESQYDRNLGEWWRYSQVTFKWARQGNGNLLLSSTATVTPLLSGNTGPAALAFDVGVPGDSGPGASGASVAPSFAETDAYKEGAMNKQPFGFLVRGLSFEIDYPYSLVNGDAAFAKHYGPIPTFYAIQLARALADNVFVAITYPDQTNSWLLGKVRDYGHHAGMQGCDFPSIGKGWGPQEAMFLKRPFTFGSIDQTNKGEVLFQATNVPVLVDNDNTLATTTDIYQTITVHAYGQRIVMCAPSCNIYVSMANARNVPQNSLASAGTGGTPVIPG